MHHHHFHRHGRHEHHEHHACHAAGRGPFGHGSHRRGGFGHGGPEGGPGGGMGGAGRGGRMFASGDLRLVLLDLIGEEPRYGYELIKAIEAAFGGAYAPSPGSVYPTLTLLEELGYVAAAEEGGKRRFAITEAGRAHLAENAALVSAIRRRMEMAARAMAGQRPPEDVIHALETVRDAIRYHRGGWDEAEVMRVRALLEDVAQSIEGGASD